MRQCGKAISASVHKIITSPTGMDSNVNRALSLYLIMAISPMMKPTSPINARAGVGRGKSDCSTKPDHFNGHQHDECHSQTRCPLSGFCLDQNCIFMIVSSLFFWKDRMLHLAGFQFPSASWLPLVSWCCRPSSGTLPWTFKMLVPVIMPSKRGADNVPDDCAQHTKSPLWNHARILKVSFLYQTNPSPWKILRALFNPKRVGAFELSFKQYSRRAIQLDAVAFTAVLENVHPIAQDMVQLPDHDVIYHFSSRTVQIDAIQTFFQSNLWPFPTDNTGSRRPTATLQHLL